MFRNLIYILFIFAPFSSSISKDTAIPVTQETTKTSECRRLYADIKLENIINYPLFERAIAGYKEIDTKNRDIITIIDFSKPSTEDRFFVIDLKQKKLLYKSVVSHGKNSGDKYARSFSNENGSYKSSLGFYVTENTYNGKNGYSLVLNGLEKGINDRAKERAIVIHGAAYSNPSMITSFGRLGRSLGCPALPQSINQSVINTIKDGTLLYIYANDQNYLAQSRILTNNHRFSLNSI